MRIGVWEGRGFAPSPGDGGIGRVVDLESGENFVVLVWYNKVRKARRGCVHAFRGCAGVGFIRGKLEGSRACGAAGVLQCPEDCDPFDVGQRGRVAGGDACRPHDHAGEDLLPDSPRIGGARFCRMERFGGNGLGDVAGRRFRKGVSGVCQCMTLYKGMGLCPEPRRAAECGVKWRGYASNPVGGGLV